MDIDDIIGQIDLQQTEDSSLEHALGCLCCDTALGQMTGAMFGATSKRGGLGYGKFGSLDGLALKINKLEKKFKNEESKLKVDSKELEAKRVAFDFYLILCCKHSITFTYAAG
mmetsp:Transcript_2206/g.3186  ORF Transcript_2206/g.3186 Transcript_2206/m.3186 type:complete len:113 (+) Transcript_2206:72-410(+)